jgi:hypothetical protein
MALVAADQKMRMVAALAAFRTMAGAAKHPRPVPGGRAGRAGHALYRGVSVRGGAD